jgi:hypothetical protein
MKKLWPKLQKYAKGEVRTGLDCVEVPIRDSDGEISGWRSVTSPTELFNTLIARNIKHFSQAKDTPFVTGNLGQYLHPFEQNHFSESILKGTVNLAHLPLNTSIHACINEMRFPLGEDGTDLVDNTISAEDFWQDSNSYLKICPPHLVDVTWDTIKRHWMTQSYVLCMLQSYPSLFNMESHSTNGHQL